MGRANYPLARQAWMLAFDFQVSIRSGYVNASGYLQPYPFPRTSANRSAACSGIVCGIYIDFGSLICGEAGAFCIRQSQVTFR